MLAPIRRRLSRPSRPEPAPTVVRRRIVRRGKQPLQVVYEEAIVHETASLQARVLATSLRIVAKPALSVVPFTDRTLGWIRRMDGISAHGPRSRYVLPHTFELGGVRVESMVHRYGPDSDMTILYFHGGGFFSGSIDTHRRICERIALHSGATVISVDYVQLPEGSVADSVADAIAAYIGALDLVAHPDKIVVAGDSAGGYLAMKVAELATLRGLTPPAAVVGFSPLLSLDPDRLDKGVVRVSRMRDAYLPIRRIATVRSRWLPEGAAIEGAESPLEATDHIDSPTFMVAVEDEILRPEVEAMALQLAARGVEVETHLWRGQVHAFPVLADALPEGKQAIRLAADFARVAVGELDPAPTAGAPLDPPAHVETIVGEIVGEDADVPEDTEPPAPTGVVDEVDATGRDGRPWWRRLFRAA